MKGYTDSVAFEMDSSILAKLHLIGVVTVAKNGLIFDDSLISKFITRKTKKGIDKQLKELKNLYQYLAILETQTGLKYKIMQHKRAKKINITFQGLKQYTEISELMEYDLKSFLELFKEDIQLIRLDVAIDNEKAFNLDSIAINTKRTIKNFHNTSYFKTASEKRVNEHLNIKHYYKIDVKLYRLEFVFLKRYFKRKNPLEAIEKTIQKAIKKRIKFIDSFSLLS
ncbi:hypothetical protein N5U17_11410 [Aliarcobacter butzleri]|uniref:hypothetical protein n=1 Tax=Aliarcobacter butzleri TaxID=28197 RepID=UPI0021B3A24F|nr:hypothetical protein [Aliarcobacter butzleri]MCT7604837.1 hypothetical protein [Aliarcobacter butzleri]